VIPLPYDLHLDAITTTEAAELAGVKPAVIRQWKHRGQLAPIGETPAGRPLYRPIDVLRAEAATRGRARRVHLQQSA
jgi:DNA-binding transcriptional MerR regulator